ncbi:TraR/DksA family transcriptional regulator [Thalassospira alkalitolerans]|jgi:DnaK suppressor protein|uniref:Conjugal transfer protein TraR n=1 Tax=Thalassospira alkalitolerans TaxID=1293890 RepID=A0A1Y2LE13_9PROT|nr:TraR/DksA family transcriptional regulator [Thalassospira alkalitolerans]OSQ49150.1 conjugal transfer protein TraR [Thalassospira alkalitolerans]|tara:strand:+ start:149121 stop:149495 length:375 start_codon:yes stop_codon:yes gene_type:complete
MSERKVSERKDLDIAFLRQRLEERRADISAHSTHSEDYRKPVELDQQAVGRLSRMDALQNQQMHLEQERRRLAELDRIEKTLSRIESANYGYCHNCGEAIEKKRLEFDPTTPLCVECAAHVSHS